MGHTEASWAQRLEREAEGKDTTEQPAPQTPESSHSMLYIWLPSKKVFYVQRKSLKTEISRSLLTQCPLAML